MPDTTSDIDFQRLFQNLPGLYIVIKPDFKVAAVTDEYLQATMVRREDLIGRNLFEVFPENPEDANNHGTANVRASLEKVFQTGEIDTLPIQKYDVQRPAEKGGGYEERYWKIATFPAPDAAGKIPYVIHRVENITEQISLQRREAEQNIINAELKDRATQIDSKRKEAEAALEDARYRLEAALNAGEIGTWTWDIVNNRVVADKNLAEFFAVSESDADGGEIDRYMSSIHPADAERIENIIGDALQNSDSYHAEYRLLKPDGAIRWVVARGRVVRDKDGAPVQLPGVVIDITERKEAENALRESEQRLKFALDAGRLGSYELDFATGKMICSARCLANFGLPPNADFPFDKFLALIQPEDRARVREAVEQAVANNSDYEIEYRIARADNGQPAWIFARGRSLYDSDGKALVMNGVTLDITKRKKAEEALRESQTRLTLALQAGRAGTFEWDIKNNRNIWSPELEELYGVARGTFEGNFEAWSKRIVNEDAKNVSEGLQAALKKGVEDFDYEFRAVLPDGAHRWFAGRARFEYDAQRQPLRMLGINIDITDRKFIEAERERLLSSEKKARAEAENANRLKDDFLATLSHELRTPLSSILGWSRLLKEGQIEGEQARRAVETIERNAKSQSQLIEDILDVSRIISGKLRLEVRPIELGSIIKMAIESVRPAAEAKNIRLQRVIDSGVTISGDADRIQQIIWNLLSNAIKFTPKQGRVQIKLERVNSHIEIVISDDGIGIEAETLPFVFERFRQSDSSTTRKHGGLGLGLAIVRHLVELHGGTVQAASDGLNQGATFTVTFPMIPLRAPQTTIEEETSERIHPTADSKIGFSCPAEIRNLRILLVDDEPDTREMLVFVFESCGAQTTGAASVNEALKAIENKEFDVLVSDIGMPERDGYDLIKNVRRLAPARGGRIPAVALTAYARVEDRMKVLSAGFQMHVPKPVEPAELLAVVASLANRNRQS